MKNKLLKTGLVALASTTLLNAQTTTFDAMNANYGLGKTISWYSSNYGAGFGHKIYNDDYNGRTYLKIAGRNNTATFSDLITIASDGQVGIGTANPSVKLEVFDAALNLTLLKLRNNNWACNQTTSLEFWNGSNKNFATSKITSKMDGCGNDGEAMVFETQTAGQTSTTSKMIIFNDGKVQIGNNLMPAVAKLDVQDMTNARIHAYTTSFNPAGIWVLNSASSYGLRLDAAGIGHIAQAATTPLDLMNFTYNVNLAKPQQVWIGSVKPLSPHNDFNFAVAGKLLAQSIYVTATTSWADYVFNTDYKLPKLTDVEAYYKENKHLPEIPSASEVTEMGIDVGAMNTLLLKKVEELTIYLVDQNKRLEKLEQENKRLNDKK